MISVSLRPSTISSNTHMFTVVTKRSDLAALAPTILAMAEPLGAMETHTHLSALASTGQLFPPTPLQKKSLNVTTKF